MDQSENQKLSQDEIEAMKRKGVDQEVSLSFVLVRIYTRQRAQGHMTYEVGIAKNEVIFVLNLRALAFLVSDM